MTVVLGLFALVALKPWDDDLTEPRLGPLGLEMAVGEATALSTGNAASVADASVARSGGSSRAAEHETPATGGAGADAVLAVAAARPVASAAPEPTQPQPAEPAPEAQPVAAAPPPPAPAPTAAPVVAVDETSQRPPPGTAGVEFEPACEGEEYTIAMRLEAAEGPEGQQLVDILLRHLRSDGGVDELHLEGDLADVQSLVLQLTSEGDCVGVEVVPPEAPEDESADASDDPGEPAAVPAAG